MASRKLNGYKTAITLFMGSQRVRHDWATELNWMYKGKHNVLRFTYKLYMQKRLIMGHSINGIIDFFSFCTFLYFPSFWNWTYVNFIFTKVYWNKWWLKLLNMWVINLQICKIQVIKIEYSFQDNNI